MKILFVVDGQLGINHWSGTSLAIYNELRKYNELDLLNIEMDYFDKIIIKLKYKISKSVIYPERTRRLLNFRKRVINDALKKKSYDAIFCIGSLVAASVPNVDIPIYMYIDGVLSLMNGYYNSNTINKKSFDIADEIEKMGLNKIVNTNGCIFTASDWCANGCIKEYGIDSQFVKVVRIGANNLVSSISDRIKKEIINNRIFKLDNQINLLFIGIDWKRKGLENAYELVRILHNEGYFVHLDIVGADVIPPSDINESVTVYGKLDKSNLEENEKISELYQTAHFFVFPTHAECVGAVICESGANALPVLANKTGGVSSLIEDNKNGFLLDLDMEKWVEKIKYYKLHINEYKKLCEDSYSYYRYFLNWEKICLEMYNYMVGKDVRNEKK